jgi:hypothetical protein
VFAPGGAVGEADEQPKNPIAPAHAVTTSTVATPRLLLRTALAFEGMIETLLLAASSFERAAR